mgnify:CR=1 FL=1
MAIRRKTTNAEVTAVFNKRIALFRKAILVSLIRIGENAITEARKNGRYIDRTGNLRSSIGYAVVDNGTVVMRSTFDTVLGKTEVKGQQLKGDTGREEGMKYLESLITATSGIQLIMVAGMPYAQYVEDMNKNVLDTAERYATGEVAKLKSKFNLK